MMFSVVCTEIRFKIISCHNSFRYGHCPIILKATNSKIYIESISIFRTSCKNGDVINVQIDNQLPAQIKNVIVINLLLDQTSILVFSGTLSLVSIENLYMKSLNISNEIY